MKSLGLKNFISVILLAGGTGSRLGPGTPKQFRHLLGKPLVLYSFEFFIQQDAVDELVVVCEKSYEHLFSAHSKRIVFARPGPSRQDSVYQGLLATRGSDRLICVHDAARPFLEKKFFDDLLKIAHETGAAALAIPSPNTIKQVEGQGVVKTLPRQDLWELQTPQMIRRSLFSKAHEFAKSRNILATDDISLVEAMGQPTYIVPSSPKNFKITTSFDWKVAETLCASN